MNKVPIFDWYTDKIKNLSTQLWLPKHIIDNKNDITHTFNSAIPFESFREDTYEKTVTHLKKFKEETVQYYINLIQKYNDNEHLKKEMDSYIQDMDTVILLNESMIKEKIKDNLPIIPINNDYEQQKSNIIEKYNQTISQIDVDKKKKQKEYINYMCGFECDCNKLKIINAHYKKSLKLPDTFENVVTRRRAHIKYMDSLITEYSENSIRFENYLNNSQNLEQLNTYTNELISKFESQFGYVFIRKKLDATKKRDKKIKLINKVIRTHNSIVPFTNPQKNKIKEFYKEALKVYNTCVDCWNNKDPKFPTNYMSASTYIYNMLYKSTTTPVPPDILSYEIKTFFENLQSCITNMNRNNIKHFEMKYKNIDKHQTITIRKNCIGKNGIYTNELGKIPNFIKSLKDIKNLCKCTGKCKCKLDIISDCKLTFNKKLNNYMLYIPQIIDCKFSENKKRVCAIDPGEKIFVSYYSLEEYGQIGKDMRIPILKQQTKIKKYQQLIVKGKPINYKTYEYMKTKYETLLKKGQLKNLSKYNKLLKMGKDFATNKSLTVYIRLSKNKLKRKINKCYKKIRGLVNELHRKTALYLCKNFDIILLPEFSTQTMVRDPNKSKQIILSNVKKIQEDNKGDVLKIKTELKQYRKRRNLNRKVKFVLNNLSHYKFKQHLLNKAKEYGCICEIVTEEYTSQLCGLCGQLSNNYVGRMKHCSHCSSRIDRDINGARNILLKNISPFIVT